LLRRWSFYARWSPANFVGEWKTPMLIIQGGKGESMSLVTCEERTDVWFTAQDYRVPEYHAVAAFTALQQ
jgi:dipeptidyl aminopeptidase/acylaminoacyl peptidase